MTGGPDWRCCPRCCPTCWVRQEWPCSWNARLGLVRFVAAREDSSRGGMVLSQGHREVKGSGTRGISCHACPNCPAYFSSHLFLCLACSQLETGLETDGCSVSSKTQRNKSCSYGDSQPQALSPPLRIGAGCAHAQLHSAPPNKGPWVSVNKWCHDGSAHVCA